MAEIKLLSSILQVVNIRLTNTSVTFKDTCNCKNCDYACVNNSLNGCNSPWVDQYRSQTDPPNILGAGTVDIDKNELINDHNNRTSTRDIIRTIKLCSGNLYILYARSQLSHNRFMSFSTGE